LLMYLLNSYLPFAKNLRFSECKDSFFLLNYANLNIVNFSIKEVDIRNTYQDCHLKRKDLIK
jgi:hypothetical protein